MGENNYISSHTPSPPMPQPFCRLLAMQDTRIQKFLVKTSCSLYCAEYYAHPQPGCKGMDGDVKSMEVIDTTTCATSRTNTAKSLASVETYSKFINGTVITHRWREDTPSTPGTKFTTSPPILSVRISTTPRGESFHSLPLTHSRRRGSSLVSKPPRRTRAAWVCRASWS